MSKEKRNKLWEQGKYCEKTSQKAKPLAKVKLFYSEKLLTFDSDAITLVSSDKIISDY